MDYAMVPEGMIGPLGYLPFRMESIPMPEALTLTRVAHATTLLDFSGELILTDPWFSEKPGYYHGEPLGVRRQDLPRLTGVAGSHGHYDHFDMADFAAYPDKNVPFAVKSGM